MVSSAPSVLGNEIFALASDSTGLYVGGSQAGAAPDFSWRAEKRNLTTGLLIPAFDTDGVFTLNPSTAFDLFNHLVLDGDALYLIGDERVTGGTANNRQWRIEKRSATDASLVAAFGSDGVVTTNPTIDIDSAARGAIRGSVPYLAGVSAGFGGEINEDWRFEKRAK